MKEYTILEWGSWEWMYVNGELFWKRRAFNANDLKFVKLLDGFRHPYDYAELSEVVGANDSDHDGCFHMVDDPPHNLKDIDYRINEGLSFIHFQEGNCDG